MIRLLLLGIFAGALIYTLDDATEARAQADQYCEMVSLHKSTGGEYGWPDYRGDYEEVCYENHTGAVH